jgi:hypothetical protein
MEMRNNQGRVKGAIARDCYGSVAIEGRQGKEKKILKL